MNDEYNRVEEGIEVFKTGDFEAAIPLLEQASREYPGSYEAFVYLGAAYSQLGRHNAAIGALMRASHIKPGSPRVHYNLGQAYEAAGVPKEAYFEYSKALELDPNYGLAKGSLVSLTERMPKLLGSHIEVTTKTSKL